MYGSLKDYLKKLVTGKLSSLHPLQAPPCSCTCHQSYHTSTASNSDRTRTSLANVNRQTDVTAAHAPPPSSSRPHPILAASTSLEDPYHDPVAAAHAARLLNLLDSNFSQSDSNVTGIEDQNEAEDNLESAAGSSVASDLGECYAGRCAYHPCMGDCLDQYDYTYNRTQVSSNYYNSYYNHRGNTGRPSEHELADTPVCTAPLLPSPQYVNVSSEEENEEDHLSGECTCTCRYPYNSTCQDGWSSPYCNVASAGCAYCSLLYNGTDKDAGAAGCVECTCRGAKVNRKGRLGYFEVLDYASQISRGMEHLENMKVGHFIIWIQQYFISKASLTLTRTKE